MQKQNFDKLIFNPFDLTDEELITNAKENEKLYKALGAEKGVVGDYQRHPLAYQAKLVRYVLYLYDKNSPLWLTHPDVVSRKKESARLAGFNINEEESTLNNIFLLDDELLSQSISAFIKYQHSDKLSVLISNEQVLYELQHVLRSQMLEFKDDKQRIDHFKTKTALLSEQDKILDLIEKYKYDIWQGDDAAYDKSMDILYDRKVTPEQIAKIELKVPKIRGLNV